MTMNEVKSALSSPWLTISVACIAIVIGYTVFLQSKGEIMASAAGQSCPMQHLCQGGNCDKSPSCANGLCGADCPGNCAKNV